ncbi:Nudix hydrolase 4 [Porphyridium purpureum]|uniref:Nudix hydrolase 4 n=1 Tax=Porphyridium purpureum TaxID=35688 RepID=A0A5J4YKV4_PORPP|nr:Nudix hydrolase 4 [Porphyridium purpureum]|eukprot:POR2778..scf249_10
MAEFATCVGTVPVRKDADGKWELLMVKTPRMGWSFPMAEIEKDAKGAKQTAKKCTVSSVGATGKLGPKLGKWRFPAPRNQDVRFWVMYVDGELGEDDKRYDPPAKGQRGWFKVGQAKNRIMKIKDAECLEEHCDLLTKVREHLSALDSADDVAEDDASDVDDTEPIVGMVKFRECAGCVPVRKNAQSGKWEVLMVQSTGDDAIWVFPKGGVEPGEPAKVTALRETREEAGAIGKCGPKLGVWRFPQTRQQIKFFLLYVDDVFEATDSRWKERKKRQRMWLTFRAAKKLIKSVPKPDRRPELCDVLKAAAKPLKQIDAENRVPEEDTADDNADDDNVIEIDHDINDNNDDSDASA